MTAAWSPEAEAPPPSRAYLRTSDEDWEAHKATILDLYINQNKSLKETIETMQSFSFAPNEKQFKRKLSEWGIVKNIPQKDMTDMAKRTKRRLEDMDKDTAWKRRVRGGEFVAVSAEKIRTFSSRNRIDQMSPTSTLGSTPSNLQYYTPSEQLNNSHTPSSGGAGSRPISEDAIREFNAELERIWWAPPESSASQQHARQGVPTIAFPETRLRTWHNMGVSQLLDFVDEGRGKVFRGDLNGAGEALGNAAIGLAHVLGQDHWLAVTSELEAALIETAKPASCFSATSLRLMQEGLALLARRRRRYACAEQTEQRLVELRKALFLAVKFGRYWSRIIYNLKFIESAACDAETNKRKQGAREWLNGQSEMWLKNTFDGRDLHLYDDNDLDSYRLRVADITESEDRIADFSAFCDHSHREFTGRARARAVTPPRTNRDRSRIYSKEAAFDSFVGKYDKASRLFETADRDYLSFEDCPEAKLHQLLWYCEHKTRIRDWPGLRSLLRRAGEHCEEAGLLAHPSFVPVFYKRIMALCGAGSRMMSIDDVDLTENSLSDHQTADPQESSSLVMQTLRQAAVFSSSDTAGSGHSLLSFI